MRVMLNLLPALYRRQQLVRKRIVQWSTLICVGLLVGWLVHWYEIYEDKALRQRLEVLKRQHQPTETMLRQLVQMRQELVEMQQQELVARELEHQRNALALLGVISQTAENTKGRLRLTRLELTDFQTARDAQGRPAVSGQTGGLLLSGVSLDNPAVAEFLDGLQDSGLFSHVELVALKERERSEVSLRDYEVRCEF